MSTVNLYDILNVSQDCSKKDIKNAYRKLAKKFYPDLPTGDAEMFELVTHAYNVLSNEKRRKEYDDLYKISSEAISDHVSLKSRSKNFMKAQETDVVKKTKKEHQIDFVHADEEFNRKHGFNPSDQHAFSTNELKRRYLDLQSSRDIDFNEVMPENLFEGRKFNNEIFNAMFDKMQPTMDLIPHDGTPLPWNGVSGDGTNFSTLNSYDNLYAEDDIAGNDIYGSIKTTKIKPKLVLTTEDLDDIGKAVYTKGHAKDRGDDYQKTLEQRIAERSQFTKQLKDRDFKDFDPDPKCGGYGIFDGIGLSAPTIDWDDGVDDIKAKYQKLLDLRRNEVKK